MLNVVCNFNIIVAQSQVFVHVTYLAAQFYSGPDGGSEVTQLMYYDSRSIVKHELLVSLHACCQAI